jgi:2-polyprenyl-6-hydroxyphenyl methylase/3-demethylubiquinone-9 3-methyltransferase
MAQGNMIDVQPSIRVGGSVVADEVARFDALAAQWWDPSGPMRPLHAMNPLRVGWIDARIRARRGGPGRLLDIGCGAGLAAESLARLGHDVLGLDAAADAVAAAKLHAAGQDLSLAYRVGAAEDLVAEGVRFPVVTALEVIEHVANPAAFLRLLASLIERGGLLFVSTLNRTLRSLAVAKLGAEYVLRLLPIGTHDWQRFVTPAELGTYGKAAGFQVADVSGMLFDVRSRQWRTGADLAVNYIAMLERR